MTKEDLRWEWICGWGDVVRYDYDEDRPAHPRIRIQKGWALEQAREAGRKAARRYHKRTYGRVASK